MGRRAFVAAEIRPSADAPLSTVCYDDSVNRRGRAIALLLGNISLTDCVLTDERNLLIFRQEGGRK
jgi:hypothetical protein